MTFVLASSSPRRKELLHLIGLDFEVIPSHIPEIRGDNEPADRYVARLSEEKARAIGETMTDRWVIAADTTVLLEHQLLEKPEDAADARRMLAAIAGETHTVYTGVTVFHAGQEWCDTQVAATRVRMLPLTSAEIAWYVDTGEPLGKAGAYAAQGIGAMFIDSIEGSYTNVVGLPLALLFQMLRKARIDPLHEAWSSETAAIRVT